MSKNPKRFYVVMAILAGVYVALAILLKPSQAMLDQYGISLTKAYIIIMSVAIMLAAIWASAVYGFVHVLEYAKLIAATKDGKAMHKLAIGLGLIAFRSPVTSIFINLMNGITQHYPDLADTGVILSNYLSVAVAVIGFWLINQASEQLLEVAGRTPNSRVRMAFRLLSLGLISLYTFLAIGRGGYQFPTNPGGRASFYLPNWLIVSTIIVPYAYAWYLAFVASYNLIFYSRNVKGVLYKQALRWVAWGINIIILSTIVFQLTGATGSRGNKLSLGPLLLAAYLLLVLIGAGFVVIAVGAKKLKRIEEI